MTESAPNALALAFRLGLSIGVPRSIDEWEQDMASCLMSESALDLLDAIRWLDADGKAHISSVHSPADLLGICSIRRMLSLVAAQ